VADRHVVDFVGYGGGANCREGAVNAPAGSNTAAIIRLGDGAADTNRNGSDFVAGAPTPRRTAPIVELGPAVLATDPRFNAKLVVLLDADSTHWPDDLDAGVDGASCFRELDLGTDMSTASLDPLAGVRAFEVVCP
jgi:hypothetical protein